MRTSTKVQTAFRLETDLLNRLKKKARAKGQSLNSIVEEILNKHFPADFEWPKLEFPKETPAFVQELKMGKPLSFTKKELEEDPRLDYLVRKHIHGEY